jgi:acetate kinase
MEAMPNIPHFAVFDTAFLSTLPPHTYMYGIPYEWYEKFDVRKYGFHGTSHLYVSRRAAALLGRKPSEVNVITVHIGNGVSITAVKKGATYDHSMGFTPLEGAVMGTRCGDIDPAIPLVMMRQLNVNADDMEKILNTKSGLLGITGKYVDRRDIRKAAKEGDERSRLAIDVECYRLRKHIGAYVAAMNGTDCIVFTAGVGENSPLYREKICENLNSLGIAIDKEKNEQAVGAGEREIGSRESRVKIFVIPTNEELVFAEDAVTLLQNRYDIHTQFEYEFQKIGYRP